MAVTLGVTQTENDPGLLLAAYEPKVHFSRDL